MQVKIITFGLGVSVFFGGGGGGGRRTLQVLPFSFCSIHLYIVSPLAIVWILYHRAWCIDANVPLFLAWNI